MPDNDAWPHRGPIRPSTPEPEHPAVKALRELLDAMEAPRSRKAAEAWDRARTVVVEAHTRRPVVVLDAGAATDERVKKTLEAKCSPGMQTARRAAEVLAAGRAVILSTFVSGVARLQPVSDERPGGSPSEAASILNKLITRARELEEAFTDGR